MFDARTDLDHLSPKERLEFIAEVIEAAINRTPTGPERNAMADAHICIVAEKNRIRD